MRLYSSKFYKSISFSKRCHHQNIFCSSYCRIGSYGDIFFIILSLKCNILTFTHIFISIAFECHQMLIDRTLSDITSSRIGDLKSSESSKKRREEEYSDTDFFDFFTIKSMYRHFRAIEMYSISFPYHADTQRFYDCKECKDITNFWNIMESESLKK